MTVCSSRNMVGVEEADRANQLPLRSERLVKIFYPLDTGSHVGILWDLP